MAEEAKRKCIETLQKYTDAKSEQFFGKTVTFGVDWSFMQSPAFQQMSDKESMINNIYNSQWSYLFGDSGFGYLVKNDKTGLFAAYVAKNINSMIIAFDPNNGVNDQSTSYSHFEFKLANGVLTATINLNKYNNSCYSADEKLEILCNLRAEQAKINNIEPLEKIVDGFENKVEKRLEITIDYKFMESDYFKSKSLSDQEQIIKYITNSHLPYVLTSGLGDTCKKDEIYKRAVQERVHAILFRYDQEDSVCCNIGSYNFYQFTLESQVLIITCNLSKWNNSMYGSDDKYDVLFNVRVEQEKANLAPKLERFETQLEEKVDKKLPVRINYAFTTNEEFTGKSLSDQTRVFNAISNNLQSILINGVADVCQRDEIYKKAIASRVKSFIYQFDCENGVADPVSSYSHYSFQLEKGVFTITVNLNKYDNSCYGVDEKLDVLFDVRVEQTIEAQKAPLERMVDVLEQYIDKRVPISIDYSFTSHADFKAKSLNDQENIIKNITNSHLPYVIINGMGDAARKSEVYKACVQNRVGYVHFKYDMENSISDDVGSYRHYSIELNHTVLIITQNIKDASSSNYGCDDKFDKLFNLRLAEGIIETNAEIEKLVDRLETAMEKRVPIKVFYSKFTKHESWRELRERELSKQSEILKAIYRSHLYQIVNNELEDKCRNKPLWKEQLRKKINLITYEFDPENDVRETDQSYNWYQLALSESGTLSFKVNMNNYNSSMYGLSEVLDRIFQIEAMEEFLELREKVDRLESEVESRIGKKVPIIVDYSFIDDEYYKDMKLDDRRRIFRNIFDSSVRYFINGFYDAWEKNKSIANGITSFIVRYDVTNEIRTNSSYNFYELTRTTSGQFINSCNIKSYNSSQYYMEEAITENFKSGPVSTLPFKLTLGTPASLQAHLDRTVGDVGTVTIEGPPTEAKTKEVPQAAIDAIISGNPVNLPVVEDVGVDDGSDVPLDNATPQAVVQQTPQTPIDDIPHLPWPDPMPAFVQKYYGKNGKEWLAREKNYKENIRKVIRITFRWEFLESAQFKRYDANRQEDVIDYLMNRHVDTIMKDGLQRLCQDTLVRDSIQQRIDRVVITYDEKSSINDNTMDSAKQYKLQLVDKDLLLTINLRDDSYNNYLYYVQEKLDPLLNLRYAQCVRDWDKGKRKEIMGQLKSQIKKEVPVDIDWESFCNHPKFTLPGAKPDQLRSITERVTRIWESLLPNCISGNGGDSLGGMAERDKIFQEAVQTKVNKVLFRYDPDDKIDDRKHGGDSCKHYKVELDPEGVLILSINLSNYNDYTYYLPRKFDYIFNLRVLQARRDCVGPLKDASSNFKSKVGKAIPFEIDFDAFCEHPNFLQYTAGKEDYSELTSLMERLWRSIASNFTYESSNSLAEMCEKDKRMKEIFQQRCDKIVFTYDPTNAFKSPFPYDQASQYRFDLADDNTFTVIVTLKNYSDYNYYCLNKLAPMWESRALVRDLQPDLQTATEHVSEAVGKQVPVFVDWNSVIKSEDFLIRNDQNAIQKFLGSYPEGAVQTNFKYTQQFCNYDKRTSLAAILDTNQGSSSTVLSGIANAINRVCQSDVSRAIAKEKLTKIVVTQLPGVEAARDIRFDAATGVLTFHFTMLGVVSNKKVDTYDWAMRVDWLLESTIPKIHKLALAQIERHRANLGSGTDTTRDVPTFSAFSGTPSASSVGASVSDDAPMARGGGLRGGPAKKAEPVQSTQPDAPMNRGGSSGGLRGLRGNAVPVKKSGGESESTQSQPSSISNAPPEQKTASEPAKKALTGLRGLRGQLTAEKKQAEPAPVVDDDDETPPPAPVVGHVPTQKSSVTNSNDGTSDSGSGEMKRGGARGGPAKKIQFSSTSPTTTTTTTTNNNNAANLMKAIQARRVDPEPEEEQAYHQPARNIGGSSANFVSASSSRVYNFESFLHNAYRVKAAPPVVVDWSFLKNEDFYRHGPQTCIDQINTLCNVVQHLYQSIGKITKHAVGDAFVNSKLRNIAVSYDPKPANSKGVDCPLGFTGDTLSLALSTASLPASLKSNLVDRLRFLFDLIVDEAIMDGSKDYEAITARLQSLYGQPIEVMLDRSITKTAAFRALPYHEQYIVVYELSVYLQKRVVEQSLFSLLQHATGIPKLCIGREIRKLQFTLSPDEGSLNWSKNDNNILGNGKSVLPNSSSQQITNIGELTKANGTFVFTYPLHSFLLASVATDWNERILDAFNLVVEIARKETDDHLAKSWKEMKTRIAKEVTLEYNFDQLSAHQKFIVRTPHERTAIIKAAQTALVDQVFLGDRAFTGPLGLCEFEESRAVIRRDINAFYIQIDADNKLKHNSFSLNAGKLTGYFNMDEVLATSFTPCGAEVETILKLRPVKEQAVFDEITKKTNQLCAELNTKQKSNFLFTIDWASLSKNPKYVATKDILRFVEIARVVGRDIYYILCSGQTNSMNFLMNETAFFKRDMVNTVKEFIFELGQLANADLIVPTTSQNNSRFHISIAFDNLDKICSCTHFEHFKEKSIDFFDLVVDTAVKEKTKDLNFVSTQVSQSIGNQIAIEIPVEFAKTPKFLGYTPTQRYVMILNLHDTLVRTCFLGDDAVTGKLGLCEFKRVTEVVKKQIQRIRVSIEVGKCDLISINGGQCVVSYSIDDLYRNAWSGLHHPFEDYMQLRPLKEECVKDEQNAVTIEATRAAFPIPVETDWSSIIRKDARDYVSEVRRFGALTRHILNDTGKTRAFCDHSAKEIVMEYSHIIDRYGKFVVTFVGKQIRNNPGNTKGLQTTIYETRMDANFTLICSWSQEYSEPGPGLHIEWAIAPREANDREKDEVSRLATIYQNETISDRNAAMQRWRDDCTSTQKSYARDVESWRKKCADVTKHNNAPCTFCKGTGRKPCGNCTGSKCRTCGGTRKKPCTWSHCPRAHSTQSMPKEPKQPRMPSEPTFRDLRSVVNDYIESL